MKLMGKARAKEAGKPQPESWEQEIGLVGTLEEVFKRNRITSLFDDKQMVDKLTGAMDEEPTTRSRYPRPT